jgi:hypothetical protein
MGDIVCKKYFRQLDSTLAKKGNFKLGTQVQKHSEIEKQLQRDATS